MLKAVALALCVITLASAAKVETFRIEFLGVRKMALDNPHDIKLGPDRKRLFVSDVDNDRVVVLDADSLALFDRFGSEHQGGTHDVDFDKDWRLYVADTHDGRVTIYEMAGNKGRLLGGAVGAYPGPRRGSGTPERPNLCRSRLVEQFGCLRGRKDRWGIAWSILAARR